MAKKSKRKNIRKANKRRMRAQVEKRLHVPPNQTSSNIKVSEAILTICEPLREQYREPHRIQAIISVTIMAWNISLFPKEEQARMQGMLLDKLPKELGGEDVGVLLACIESLIERKNTYYPDVREYILTHNLSRSGDTMTLTVGTSPIPEKSGEGHPDIAK